MFQLKTTTYSFLLIVIDTYSTRNSINSIVVKMCGENRNILQQKVFAVINGLKIKSVKSVKNERIEIQNE